MKAVTTNKTQKIWEQQIKEGIKKKCHKCVTFFPSLHFSTTKKTQRKIWGQKLTVLKKPWKFLSFVEKINFVHL